MSRQLPEGPQPSTSSEIDETPIPPAELSELTLLEQLERRQTSVLAELDELEKRIDQLLQQCLNGRADRAA